MAKRNSPGLDRNKARTHLYPTRFMLRNSPMPEAVADLPIPPVILLLFETGIGIFQRVGPDPFSPRAHARAERQPLAPRPMVKGCCLRLGSGPGPRVKPGHGE